MVAITFPDSETQKRALGLLLGRFSGKVLKSGEHLVPEAALAALADQDISFTVHGKATYEKQQEAPDGLPAAVLPCKLPRGPSAAEVAAQFKSDKPAPDDNAVKQWMDEYRMEKYAK